MERDSYGSVLKEVRSSLAEFLRSEVHLFKAELKDSARRLGKHSFRAAAFGGLVVISVLPFLAFLVIGLGRLLDDRYWLSSLIVSGVCAVVGGVTAWRAVKKIQDEDFTLRETRRSIEQERRMLLAKAGEFKESNRGRAA